MKHALAAVVLGVVSAVGVGSASRAHAEPPPRVVSSPDASFGYAEPKYYPSLAWILTQLVPSPEVAFGTYRSYGDGTDAGRDVHSAFGLRWQLTPVVWSWGVNRRLNRFRWFVIDPIARNSGSIELDATFEYLFGYVDHVLVRPGVRANFPLVSRGEYLSTAIGTSIYRYDSTTRVAYDAGLYTLWGTLGFQITVAQNHAPLTAIATLRLRFF